MVVRPHGEQGTEPGPPGPQTHSLLIGILSLKEQLFYLSSCLSSHQDSILNLALQISLYVGEY